MSIPSVHPPEDRLLAFGLGLLEPPEMASVEEHLQGCEPCATVLNVLPSDEFLTALRDAASPTAETPTRWRIEETPGPNPSLNYTDPPTLPPELDGHPRYRVAELLGRGGMGAVYRASHTLMDRPVALKVMSAELFQNDEALARFRQEVRVAAQLHHPNIVGAYDADQAGSLTFLVMEYVEGQSLSEVLKARGPLPVTLACQYIRQAALGLQHAHEKGMVHRDIKPHNLMLTPSGEVKVLDFGLARFVCERAGEPEPSDADVGSGPTLSGSLTQTGEVMGTVDYMAPEQARDSRSADIRADIYSLGCTLYYFLTGRVPYPGGDVTSKLTRLLVEEPVSLSQLRPDAPRALTTVVARMMAKKLEARYQTPAEVVAALAPFAGVQRPRHRAGLLVAAVVFLAVLAGAFLYLREANKVQEITLKTDLPDTEVVVNPSGEIVRVLDRPADRAWVLEPGNFRLEDADGPDGLRLPLDEPTTLTLRREGKSVRAVWNEPSARVPPAAIHPTLRVFGPDAPAARGLAVSSDGNFAVSSGGLEYTNGRETKPSADTDLRLWDLKTGALVRRLLGQSGDVGCVAFSPNSRWVAGADAPGRVVRVWDVRSGRLLQSLTGHTADVVSVAFSPDGRRLLSASRDGSLRLWDGTTGKELLRFGEGATEWNRAVFAPDGRAAAAAGNGRLSWFNLATAEEVHRFTDPQMPLGRVLAVAVSPDGRYVLSGSGESADTGVRLWDTTTGKLVRLLGYYVESADAVAFTPDGARAVATGFDGTVRVWTVADGLEQFRAALGQPALSLAVSADGLAVLAGCVDKWLRVVRLDTPSPLPPVGELRQMLGHMRPVHAAAVSRDGRFAYSSAFDWTGRVWDLNTGREARRIGKGEQLGERYLLSADGRGMIAYGGGNTCRILDPESGKELGVMKDALAGFGPFGLSPDRRYVLMGAGDGMVWVWDLKTGENVRRLRGHTAAVPALTFCPDGARVLTTGHDATVRLWDVGTGEELKKFEGFTWQLTSVAVSPDGRLALACNDRGNVARLWDIETGKELRRLGGDPNVSLQSVAFSSDGSRVLLGAADGKLSYWDVASGLPLGTYRGHSGSVTTLTFCREDTCAVSGGADGTVRLWRLPEQAVKQQPSRFIPIDRLVTQSVAFTPDGKRLLVGQDGEKPYLVGFEGDESPHAFRDVIPTTAAAVSPDARFAALAQIAPDHSGTLRLFELATGKLLHQLPAHQPSTLAIAFAPNGNRLVTSGRDGKTCLWNVRTGELVLTFEGKAQSFRQIAFTPDGKRVVGTSGASLAQLWDAESGQLVRSFGAPELWVSTVAVMPDGRHFVTGGADQAGTLQVWALDQERPVRSWQTGRMIGWVSLSPDGTRLLATHLDQSLTQWNVQSGRHQVTHIDPESFPQQGIFSPDGRSVVAPRVRGISVWPVDPSDHAASQKGHGFREAHDLEEQKFREWAEGLRRGGLRLVTLSARTGGGAPRFNGIAVRDERGTPTHLRTGMSGVEAGAHFRQLAGTGHRPLVSCLYADGGKQKQAHLWAADGVGFSGFGTTIANLPQMLEDHGRKQRMMPIYLSAETRTGEPDQLTIIFAPDDGVAWEAKSDLTEEELQALAKSARSRSWRLTHLNVYDTDKGPRFLAVVAESPAKLEWDCRTGLTVREYEKALKEHADRMHPIAVCSWTDGDKVRYAAAWATPIPSPR